MTPDPTPDFEQQVPPELQEAIERLRATPEVRGILLVGSRTRGFHEGTSDFDLEVIVEDSAFAALAPADRLALVWDGRPFQSRLLGDVLTESWSHLAEKEQSPLDVDHWPYEAAPIWFDRDGSLAPLVAAIARFPEAIWEERLQLHYVDFWYHTARARRTAERGSALNHALVLHRAVHACLQTLFVLNRRWPPLPHWAEQALARSDLPLRPPDDIALLSEALATQSAAPLQRLNDGLAPLFDGLELTWHREKIPLLLHVLGPECRAARERWLR